MSIDLLKEQVLAQEELREHMIASLRGDTVRQARVRDEALTVFYQVISTNESVAVKINKSR